jgi:hypothetical protein
VLFIDSRIIATNNFPLSYLPIFLSISGLTQGRRKAAISEGVYKINVKLS